MVFEAMWFDMIMRDWVNKVGQGLKTKPWNFPVVGSKLEEKDIAIKNEKDNSCEQNKEKALYWKPSEEKI